MPSFRMPALAVIGVLAVVPGAAIASDRLAVYQAIPSEIDPAVREFDDPNIAITSPDLPQDAPLVVFMPGTGGKPGNSMDILRVIAGQEYRVIGLEYNNVPAVVQVCPRNPDPDCSAAFREMRIYGEGDGAPVSNSPEESIISRLVAMLRMLNDDHPGEGWGRYLNGDEPRWDRIVLSGLSQGAGMAAYMAKQHMVRRVVLFSSPWDYREPDRSLAPWLSDRSATPMDRWQAEYHEQENTADLLEAAYRRLGIPAANVHVFSRDLPPGMGRNSSNPYHGATIRDTRYADEWRVMFGRGTDPVRTP